MGWIERLVTDPVKPHPIALKRQVDHHHLRNLNRPFHHGVNPL